MVAVLNKCSSILAGEPSLGTPFSINAINQLTDQSLDLTTSIHWHGIFQKRTNYVDGVSFVTQCPIIPNDTFVYNFNALNQSGTFWYHSHLRNQYCDGLRGAFIIDDPDDPHRNLYDVDNDDTIITLADWYHYLSTNRPAVPAFNSTLINGKSRYPDRPANVSLAVVNVRRYRFRLISISCDPNFTFSIDGHQMTVIEVEGNNVQPLRVDSLEIFAAQRYSVVVNANQPVDNYCKSSLGRGFLQANLTKTGMRALPNAAGRNFSNLNNLAVLHYAGAPDTNPTVDPTVNIPVSKLPLVETNLHPLTPSQRQTPFPAGADININVDVVLYLRSPAQQGVELTIPGGAIGGPHPVHLHGHAFSVVRSAGNDSYNFDTPVIRDVVSIGNASDNVTIRFSTDNPGPWFFHCHIDWHLAAGFAIVFAEDVPDVLRRTLRMASFLA
ncbi:multicopper oxidase-domain-containing protein [Multifurca ochricompacta]|uniref:Multicopper oxidase-domain-containing protein n=1 Tax=Multifurca ochricompacta TaxID=376703 RepID=A0AAD4M0J7_9AGAM|nr:multicopper oxidase-domain-containing protein [Multifurca ochricompacta]